MKHTVNELTVMYVYSHNKWYVSIHFSYGDNGWHEIPEHEVLGFLKRGYKYLYADN